VVAADEDLGIAGSRGGKDAVVVWVAAHALDPIEHLRDLDGLGKLQGEVEQNTAALRTGG
jgi:hypothetical protein